MNNRTSTTIVMVLIFLAAIGMIGKLIEDPTQVLKSIAAFLILGFVVFLIVRRLYTAKAGPKNREQQAFRKAAKKSQKRFNRKTNPINKKTSNSPLSTIKKHKKSPRKSTSHLKVIEGKKGKKKNRASF